MKKYKLIKEYPGSPKLKNIVIQDKTFKDCYIVSETSNYHEWKVYDCENYPEFWEEIVEKDYEILSFYNKEGNSYYNITTFGYYSEPASQRSLEFCTLYYKINSIKRLSDSEIFAVGDKLCDGLINDIVMSNKDLWLFHNGKKPNVKLKDAIKFKQPLFTTEDGVDIFEGDTIFGVNADWKIFSHYTDLQNKVKSWGIKPIFPTKEKAEEYILMNKKSLSINNILKVWSDLSGHAAESLSKNSTLMKYLIKHLKDENNKK
jgi:hypothetical protein